MNISCQKEFFTAGQSNKPAAFISPQVTITQQELLSLTRTAAYWQGQHKQAIAREKALKKTIEEQKAKIRDLNKRLFGKKSEKKSSGGKKVAAKLQLPNALVANNQVVRGTDAHFTRISLLLKNRLISQLRQRVQAVVNFTFLTVVKNQKSLKLRSKHINAKLFVEP